MPSGSTIASDIAGQPPSGAARELARQELGDVTHSLIAEFSGMVPAGTVIRQVAQARELLLAVGVRQGLAPAAEVIVRARLREIVPAHGE